MTFAVEFPATETIHPGTCVRCDSDSDVSANVTGVVNFVSFLLLFCGCTRAKSCPEKLVGI